MESNAADNPVPREITALLSDQRFILRETQRAVTPFGGLAVFISFLGKIGLVEKLRQFMPVRWRSSSAMSLGSAIPWRVALQQGPEGSPPPLHRPISILHRSAETVNHHLAGGGEFSTGDLGNFQPALTLEMMLDGMMSRVEWRTRPVEKACSPQ
ncbi:MAG: hypothetical protein ABSE56_03670 [Bryobacteraceae bacterium]|jgi:hypothetical protein